MHDSVTMSPIELSWTAKNDQLDDLTNQIGVSELKAIWKKRNNAFRLQIHPFGLKYACNITSHSHTQNQNLNESLAVSFYFIIVISLTGHVPSLGGVVDGALSYRLLCKGDKAGKD